MSPLQLHGDPGLGLLSGRISKPLIAGAHIRVAMQESSWREDCHRPSNGDQVSRVAALGLKSGKSVDFTSYWQRHLQS